MPLASIALLGESFAVKAFHSNDFVHGFATQLGELFNRPTQRDHRCERVVLRDASKFLQARFSATDKRRQGTAISLIACAQKDIPNEGVN